MGGRASAFDILLSVLFCYIPLYSSRCSSYTIVGLVIIAVVEVAASHDLYVRQLSVDVIVAVITIVVIIAVANIIIAVDVDTAL